MIHVKFRRCVKKNKNYIFGSKENGIFASDEGAKLPLTKKILSYNNRGGGNWGGGGKFNKKIGKI